MKKILFVFLMSLLATVAIAQQQTPKPEIYVDDGTDVCDVWAYGEGEVHLFMDSVEVDNPCRINKDYVEQSFFFGAYAEVEGCYPSEWVYCEVIVPAMEGPILPVEPDMGLNITVMDEYILIEPYIDDEIFSAGTVLINGELFDPPYMLPRYNYDYEYFIYVEFIADGYERKTYEETIIVPAVENPILPVEPDYGVHVTITDESVLLEPYVDPVNFYNGVYYLRLFIDDQRVNYPYTLPRSQEEYVVCATVQIYLEGIYEPLVCNREIVVPALEPIPPYKKYDVNGDGEVNIADVNAINNSILSSTFDEAYDVNDDGEVNIADINEVISFIIGRTSPAALFLKSITHNS